MLLIAGVLNILTCVGVVLVPSVYSLRASAAPVHGRHRAGRVGSRP